MIDTRVNIAGVELKNPVMTASGTFGSGMEYSEFVEYGNVDLLEKAVTKWLNTDKPDNISETAKERYSKENMAKNYIKIYRSMQGENDG